MLELYHDNVSVCAQKVRVVLFEKNIAWESRHINLAAGEQISPEFLRVNPRGVVPALVDDGRPITESTIICEYLEDANPEPAMRPVDPYDRAVMRKWCRIPDDGIHVACGSVSFAAAFAEQMVARVGRDALEKRLSTMPDRARAARHRQIIEKGFDAPIVQDAVRVYAKMLRDMDAQLGKDRPWLAGETFSLAEACILPYVERLFRLGLEPMWADLPEVTAWFARIRERMSYSAAFTAFPPQGYNDLLSERGESVWPQVRKILQG